MALASGKNLATNLVTIHLIENFAESRILKLILIVVNLWLQLFCCQPVQNAFQDGHFSEENHENGLAVEARQQRLWLDSLDSFLLVELGSDTDQLHKVALTVLAIQPKEGVRAWVLDVTRLGPPPVLVDIVVILGQACIQVSPNADLLFLCGLVEVLVRLAESDTCVDIGFRF